MYFVPSERITLFIDGSNLHATARALGFDVDFRKLLALSRGKAQLIRALYYTTLIEDQEFSSLRPLVDWLAYNGYAVVLKPMKTFTDGDGRRRNKGSMHVELVVDALNLASALDHVVVVSGDGEFTALVAALQAKGKRVSIVSTLATEPPMVADELRRQADQFIDLADLTGLTARVSPTPAAAAAKPKDQAQAADTRPAQRPRPQSTPPPTPAQQAPPSATPG